MDRAVVWEFMERFVGFASGAATIYSLAVADRSGLLAVLADSTPMTLSETAGTADLDERYVEEILAQLTAAGVVDYDPMARTYLLPPEHATVIADDSSPYAMTGWLDMLPTAGMFIDDIAQAARTGGGVDAEDFGDRMVLAVDRANAPSTRILLTRRWLPTMPDVVARLEAGGRVADIGCGAGVAVLTMAAAYPNSEFVGYDVDSRAVAVARERGAASGLGNVAFEECSATEIPIEPRFDLITAFDVIHDLAAPRAAVARIREALADDGTFLMMEPAVHPDLEDNIEPRAALLYGVSLLFCMTQSLAAGGEGLGTAWGPRKAEDLCREAGFGHFRRLPVENPFSAFYEVRR
ncbi:MAG TPA: class I SAM-dependent methyltransferase [Acidimicrobiia bacterium]|nr:class I SAM-dependent methyltransferase [Acidimicrobiia bacterium]